MVNKFWADCDDYQRSILVSSVFVLSIAIACSIFNSNELSISSQGLEVTKTAIANQKELESALLLIQIQQSQISSFKERAIEINERTKVGGLLAQDLTKAEENFNPKSIEQIEQTIERSQAVLDQQLDPALQ
ncbi:MAG: hypothetical protein RLZZ574_2651 [Cyanobacteriota bacterium]|jgi:hypothetical protein